MSQNRPVPFKISSLDSLGQGVSKIGERITFVPKTLPGEEGEASIQAEKKGVAFAKMVSLKSSSPDRIEPVCPHFQSCPSCHYLHTNYDSELRAKKESFLSLFRKLPLPEVQVIPAPRRTGYRNRIQLHYDTKRRKLGMLDARSREIVPVPACLIGEAPVREKLRELYASDLWLKFAPKSPDRGHVEIYLRENEVQLSWNSEYASGGFTQVFAEMNEKLRSEIEKWYGGKPGTVLDLFAGNGNLSEKLTYSRRLCVDIYTKPKTSEFISQSLYEKSALKRISTELKNQDWAPQVIILDPPRSGLMNLDEWLQEFAPERVAYVSCDPHTMVRDLQKVQSYRPSGAILLDFFPSTFHFESLIFLERK